MAQHDYNLANADGATFRSDLNSALGAIVSNNSGSAAPSTTFAYQFWADTTTGLFKQRNAANSGWVTIGTLDAANWGLATLASPTLTGTPAAPTAATGTSTTQLATTAFVQQELRYGTLTIADAAATSITPPSTTGIILLDDSASEGGLFFYRVDGAPALTDLGTRTAQVNVTTGALTGTTGTAGKLTISAHTDGKVYIENRRGGSRSVRYQLFDN